ncbi:SAM-dependent methyltransferase [Actinophytocola sp.]|uniref:SAM-dependent methyltransferase n=1 Tax=Actinophytocola sp. TaxID=1872138 RepID=UPI003D6A3BD4
MTSASTAATRSTVADAVGATSLMTAAIRADESTLPDRMFDDPYAGHFAGEAGRAMLGELDLADQATEQGGVPGGAATRGFIALRTRFIDGALHALRTEDAGRQVVMVAAGMDARAYRHPWLSGAAVYELDQPGVLAYKQSVIDRLGLTPHARRRPVPADLTGNWVPALRAAGFELDRPSVWVAEGLMYYLPGDAVRALLTTIATLSTPDSRLLVDLVNADMLTVPETREMLRRYERWGCPWQFGTSEPVALLAEHGFTATTVGRPGVPPHDHVRWPLPDPPAGVAAPRSYFVNATRNG